MYNSKDEKFNLFQYTISNMSKFFYNVAMTSNPINYNIIINKKYTTWKEFQKLNDDYMKKNDIPKTLLIYKLWF